MGASADILNHLIPHRHAVTVDCLAAFDGEICAFLERAGIDPAQIQLDTPTDREFGERSSNVAFRLARERRQAPQVIAAELATSFDAAQYRFIEAVEPAGKGFLNFRLRYGEFIPYLIESIAASGQHYGRRPGVVSRRIVVEHTSVNPNAEWHIGHVRNAVLGDVLGRILRLEGHDVEIQNYVDDTGLQAAQAVLALLEFPEAPRPNEKFDHLVGRHYVKVAAELASEPQLKQQLETLEPAGLEDTAGISELAGVQARLTNIERLKKQVLRVMHELEAGEHASVIEQILRSQLQTAYRLGIFYDLLSWESHLVRSHLFDDAMNRLEESEKVYRPRDGRYAGTLVIAIGEPQEGDEPKREVLIRSSGLPTYVAKDIAYHMWKFGVVPDRLRYTVFDTQPNGSDLISTSLEKGDRTSGRAPDGVINLIGVNQSQAQAAVREGLRAGGFPEAADHLVHLGYGLVSTASGKISSRRGSAPAGDTIIDEAVTVAYERVKEKRSQDLTDLDMRSIAESVAVGAIRYFMVQYNPLRDIVFDVKDVVSFDGNTALYVQYALVRCTAILRRAEQERDISEDQIDSADVSVLTHDQERRLAFHLAQYPASVADAARTLAVNLVAEFAFDLATIFNQFYRDCPVLTADSDALRLARLRLVRTVRDVLRLSCSTLGVPVIERL